ncbi:hypothetical protein GCM10022223_61030 [Kineosporia mesophila]|uniref:Uncharacterized protein n=1 Tax=Kineosporia mesophila TaxID=566012 RepID=A0ABP7AJZ0_9ACTN
MHGWVFLTEDPAGRLTEDAFRERFPRQEISYQPVPGALGSYGRCGHALVSHDTHDGVVTLMRQVSDFNRGRG